jgi:hypothetical protein
MAIEVKSISNSMIQKAALPNFRVFADQRAECMRIGSLNELHGMLYGYILSGSEQQMHMIRHENKPMQRESSFAPVAVNGFQEQSRVRFDNEESAPLPCREGDEISSGRRKESGGFQEQPQRLKPKIFSKPNPARVELVPFPVVFPYTDFILGKNFPLSSLHQSRIPTEIHELEANG